ncbi:Solute carrier family 2, facilitated glucose transporter member 3 isoform 3 [Schistosoma japonicum]|uniref:Solute carrier family 2, facilitated glucose transporter member 3 isoform 3 n=1 Tax=Schistosoma japonicum TaxID=6182 RepID=A0A4Z2DNA6_SCHJA|nr:Solute carrier family 2, facilitated glucose transporter member 3 isoform 3 [Schistosoma japonicum]
MGNKKKNFTKSLALSVFLTCLGSSFVIGYNLGVLNLPGEHIKQFLSETMLGTNASEAENTTNIVTPSFLYAQVSTAFVLAGAVGAFSCGVIADFLGRRNGLLVNSLLAIAGGVLVGPCVAVRQPALLFVGRILNGFNFGISMGVAPMYLTEIAPISLRGGIGSLHQLALTIGIFVSYLVTLTYTLNTPTLWPISVAVGSIPALISLILLPYCPESPRFLFIKKKKEEQARKAFKRLNCKDDINATFEEMKTEMSAAANQPKFKFTKLFTQKDLRMPVIIACLIQVFQQLSGINAVITYSSTMLKTAGIPLDYIQFCVVAVGVINVLMTVLSVSLIERAGRRTLLLWPTVLLGFSLLFLTISVNIASSTKDPSTEKAAGIISAILIILYICGFALGLGPIPGIIVAEIFRQEPRAAAYSLSQGVNLVCNLLVLFSYPSINDAVGGYSFIPFLVVVVICWIFFYLYMIETKNRTCDSNARDLATPRIVACQRPSRLSYKNEEPFYSDE